MTIIRTVTTSAIALAIVSISSADPAAAIRRAIQDTAVQSQVTQWSVPFAIDSKVHPKGAFASLGGYYANYSGRQMEMGELFVGANVTEALQFWLGRQSYRINGRHAGNRLDLNDNVYGVKYVVRPAVEAGDPSIALEFQTTQPGTAVAQTNNASATFFATKNYAFAVDYGMPNGLETQLSFNSVKGAGSGNASIFGLAVGKDLTLKHGIKARLQGNLFGQTYTDTVQHVDFEVKPTLYGALSYNASSQFRIEGDATLIPFGMPIGGTHFTGLSSFEIYRPGGVSEQLRKNFVAFASLRLVYHISF